MPCQIGCNTKNELNCPDSVSVMFNIIGHAILSESKIIPNNRLNRHTFAILLTFIKSYAELLRLQTNLN